ncbi:helix-turn-helix domain-containing protein [Streptosporangium sp. KLBMP 9127]
MHLKAIRNERDLSQEALADRAGLSKDLISKLEQGRRQSCRITSLMKLANALDVDLTELTGKRERLGTDRDGGSVLAIRNAILSPSLLPGLPGLDADDDGEPTPLPELGSAVTEAWRQYWRGEFGPLTAAMPGLIAEARLTHRSIGPGAATPLAQIWQLTAALMEQFGKTDLAAIAAERGIVAAVESSDQLQWAVVQRTYAWVLLNQARPAEAEALALQVANQVEPSFSGPADHIAVWGSLLITAVWSATATNRNVREYLAMAAAGAERVGRRVDSYQTFFGPSEVAWHAVHVHAMRKEPSEAFKASRRVEPGDLLRIKYGRHLIDLAQAHVDAQQPRAAAARLEEAQALSPVWFRHMEVARSLVADVRELESRPSPAVRSLARSVGLT